MVGNSPVGRLPLGLWETPVQGGFGMLRIGLSMYLVLATAAGPGLCCCLPARLLTELLASRSSGSEQVAGASHQSCGCHHDHGAVPHGHKSPSPDQDKPGCPDCPSCPCKQPGLDTSLPPQDAEQLNNVLVRSFLDVPAGLAPAAPLTCFVFLCVAPPGWGDGTALPFLSARDYLATLHILRC